MGKARSLLIAAGFLGGLMATAAMGSWSGGSGILAFKFTMNEAPAANDGQCWDEIMNAASTIDACDIASNTLWEVSFTPLRQGDKILGADCMITNVANWNDGADSIDLCVTVRDENGAGADEEVESSCQTVSAFDSGAVRQEMNYIRVIFNHTVSQDAVMGFYHDNTVDPGTGLDFEAECVVGVLRSY